MITVLIMIALFLMALFLILLVLVQRGRGGGLAGALGGAGGQSAFGARAGDTFTKVTMWSAFIWIVLCVISVRYLAGGGDALGGAPEREEGVHATQGAQSDPASSPLGGAPSEDGGN